MATDDSVAIATPLDGATLRDRYWSVLEQLTFGLVRRRGNSVVLGPLELLRFGEPRVSTGGVEWPIEGGLLAGAPGGRWRLESRDGVVSATVEGYRPSLPRPIYAISHLQVHLLFTRLLLLQLHGRTITPAPTADRFNAAAVDVAFCLTVARYTPARRRPWMLLGLVAGYHIACWSTSGRTLGGLVVGQRVVSLDGRPPTPAQSVVRLLAAPVSWVLLRPVHDELSGTEVISE